MCLNLSLGKETLKTDRTCRSELFCIVFLYFDKYGCYLYQTCTCISKLLCSWIGIIIKVNLAYIKYSELYLIHLLELHNFSDIYIVTQKHNYSKIIQNADSKKSLLIFSMLE